MSKQTDICVVGARLYFIPVTTRVPLKFGTETLTSVTCARACIKVADRHGRTAEGWGETPLSVQWVWPGKIPYTQRHQTIRHFCVRLAEAWSTFDSVGHPVEIGHDFIEQRLPGLLREVNASSNAGESSSSRDSNGHRQADAAQAADVTQGVPSRSDPGDARAKEKSCEQMPWLAVLLCDSVFDQAIHDAFGKLLQRPVYDSYGAAFMNRELSDFLQPAADAEASFQKKYVDDFLLPRRLEKLLAWHLVGGLDPLDDSDLTGDEPRDGYPVLLRDWIRRDGLKCLKVKLRGNDETWDFERLLSVGEIALDHRVECLSADFNCTVTEPSYVNAILDQLRLDQPRIFERILYVEQPFPYELEQHRLDVRGVSSRKPLFLDESAHDWRLVKLGRELGWTGVALKTCKTQTGALLSACWAKAHGMQLMVQDLTNPMLAQIPHVLLAAHVGTIRGIETNAMQFYPEASAPEAAVHPGIYRRREGVVDLSTLRGPGFGYRQDKIRRQLPAPAAEFAR